ncbi:MAG: hypothetical protein KJ749_05090 [Planctomycetes bacterium]|nr:hypothetical protein [Planctomycetota bacterium]
MKLALSRKNLWEKIPPWGKRGLAGVLEWIPPQWLLGARFRRGIAFLRTAQWWSSEQARAYQGRQLQRICRLAYDNSRFYRDLFATHGCCPDDLRGPEALVHLPTIDKESIRENLEDMCCTSTGRANVDYVSTGGTGGTPLRFYIGAERSTVEYAHLVMSWARAGYRLTYPLAVLRGQPVGEDRTGLRHEYDPLLRRHYYSNYHMTDENMGRYLDHMSTIGPCFLHVYPS